MTLNPNIILKGNTPNLVNALAQGTVAASQANAVQDQNKLRNLYAQQGAGIAGGDPDALNALAGIDPNAALDVQKTRLGMDQTRHSMRVSEGHLAIARKEAARMAAKDARAISVEEAQAASQKLKGIYEGAAMAPDEASYNAWLQQNGIDPAQYPFAQRDMHLAQLSGATDALELRAKQREMEMGPKDPASIQALKIRAQEAGYTPGTPEYQQFMLNGGPPKNGITVTSPDGTEMTIGGAATGGDVGKTGQNAMDVREIDSRDSLARLDRIEENFNKNPDLFNSLGMKGSLEAWGLKWADFVSGGDLTKEQADKLVAVTQMRGDVLENLNYTIKAITGAAMTEPEAKRIGATLPGIKDGPTVFKAKMDRALESTRMAVARYNYWRNNGLEGDPTDVGTLADMDGIIQKRADELNREELAKGGEPSQAWNNAKARLKEEFGL